MGRNTCFSRGQNGVAKQTGAPGRRGGASFFFKDERSFKDAPPGESFVRVSWLRGEISRRALMCQYGARLANDSRRAAAGFLAQLDC